MAASNPLIRRVSRLVSWHRRLLAALAAALAVLAGLSALAPPASGAAQALAAARDLPAGSRIGPDDVRLVAVPDDLLPADALRAPDDAIGRVLTHDLSPPGLITSGSLLAPRAASVGMALVPVRVSDPDVASWLRIGDQVSVVVAGADGEAATIADSARVAAIPAGEGEGMLSTSGGSQPLIVIEVKKSDAANLALMGAQQSVGLVLG